MKLTNKIIESEAKELGFDLVGFSDVSLLKNETLLLEKWLANGFHSGMGYMERNFDKRKDVKELLSSAKSVVSLGLNYFVEGEYSNDFYFGKVSRYAWGKDYHYVIWEKLNTLISKIKSINPQFECFSNVDTGPVMDKAWAVKSGLGWQGKNSNIINNEIGSWFFIATLITNHKFAPSGIKTDHCGNCTACIDSCPTEAIVEPYIVDANRCISYLTIENKGEISDEFQDKFDNWIFGCDICQEVCPWNQKFSTATSIDDFANGDSREIELESVSELTNSKFKKSYFSSPIYRAKAKGLKRNAKFLLDCKNINEEENI